MNSKSLLLCWLLTLLAWGRPFRLDLDGRKLNQLENSTLWSNVGDLDLSFNQLSALPAWTARRWQNLEMLDLGSNKFAFMPASVYQLKKLKRLSLRMNPITSPNGPWQQLAGLNRLDAASLKLSEVPENLGQLKNLTHLDLSANQLTQIPDGLGHLKSMVSLNLAENARKRDRKNPPGTGQIHPAREKHALGAAGAAPLPALKNAAIPDRMAALTTTIRLMTSRRVR